MQQYIDYKAIIWFRIPIEKEKVLKKIIKDLEKGTLPVELYSEFDTEHEIGPCEPLYETEEFINPVENDGQSTIEVFKIQKDKQVMVWDNSYESEIKRKKDK